MKKIIFPILISLLLCGCSKNNIPAETTPSTSATTPTTTSVTTTTTTAATTTTTKQTTTTTSKVTTTTTLQTVPSDAPIVYGPGSSFFASDWYYPDNMKFTYDYPAGFLIKGMEERLGCTGEELGYEGEWCALILSDLLRRNDFDILLAYNPCDLAVTLLNNNYAEFYCLREKNFDSLIENGLVNTERVKMTDLKKFKPKRGDIVCFLFTEDAVKYNWSHVGMVAEDYVGGKVIHTIEGNVGKGFEPLEHQVKLKERKFDETTIGFIRITSGPIDKSESDSE